MARSDRPSLLVTRAAANLARLAPAAGVATGARAACRRRQGESLAGAWAASVVDLLTAASSLGILFVTLLPTGDERVRPSLIPFSDLARMLAHGSLERILLEGGGNILLFAPLGLFAPLSVPALRDWRRITLFGAAFSTSIETLQYLLGGGRTASVDDVILNTLGTAAGYLALHALQRFSPIRDLLPPRSC